MSLTNDFERTVTFMATTESFASTMDPQVGVNAQTSETMKYALLTMLTIFSLCGVFGNSLVIYVYVRKNDNQTSTLYIIVLALTDLVASLVVMPATAGMEYINFEVKTDILCRVYVLVTTSNIPYSALVMTAIAVDRYICICHPLSNMMNIQRAKVISIVLIAIGLFLGLMPALSHSVYVYYPEQNTDGQNATNSTLSGEVFTGYCGLSFSILSQDFQFGFHKFHFTVFGLCAIIITVFYGLVFRSILQRKRRRKSQSTLHVLHSSSMFGGTGHCGKQSFVSKHFSKALKSQTESVKKAPKTEIESEDPETFHVSMSPQKSKLEVSPNVEQASSTHEFDCDDSVVPYDETKPLNADEKLEIDDQENPTQNKVNDGYKKICIKPMSSFVYTKNNDTRGWNIASVKMAGLRKFTSLQRKTSTSSSKKARSNIRIALTLFAVTICFVVTFLPTALMMNNIIDFQVLIYYAYFLNNILNPVIYSACAPKFRQDVTKLFRC